MTGEVSPCRWETDGYARVEEPGSSRLCAGRRTRSPRRQAISSNAIARNGIVPLVVGETAPDAGVDLTWRWTMGPLRPLAPAASGGRLLTVLHLATPALLQALIGCTPAEKARDVTAVTEGPDQVAVGEAVQLTGRLEYSDGFVLATQPTANESLD